MTSTTTLPMFDAIEGVVEKIDPLLIFNSLLQNALLSVQTQIDRIDSKSSTSSAPLGELDRHQVADLNIWMIARQRLCELRDLSARLKDPERIQDLIDFIEPYSICFRRETEQKNENSIDSGPRPKTLLQRLATKLQNRSRAQWFHGVTSTALRFSSEALQQIRLVQGWLPTEESWSSSSVALLDGEAEIVAVQRTQTDVVDHDREQREEVIQACRFFLSNQILAGLQIFEKYSFDAVCLLFCGLCHEFKLIPREMDEGQQNRQNGFEGVSFLSETSSIHVRMCYQKCQRFADSYSTNGVLRRGLKRILRLLTRAISNSDTMAQLQWDPSYAAGMIHLLILKNEEEAFRFFNHSITTSSEQYQFSLSPSLLQIANSHYRHSDFRASFKTYLRIVKTDPTHVTSRINCGLLLEHNLVQESNVIETRKLAWQFYLSATRCASNRMDKYDSWMNLSEAVGRGLDERGKVVDQPREMAESLRFKSLEYLQQQ